MIGSARHRRDGSKEDRFRWQASSGQGGVTRPECSRSRWEIQLLSLGRWRIHSSPNYIGLPTRHTGGHQIPLE